MSAMINCKDCGGLLVPTAENPSPAKCALCKRIEEANGKPLEYDKEACRRELQKFLNFHAKQVKEQN